MSVYLDANSVLHRDAAASVLRCPHCEAASAMRISAAPDFGELQRNRPGRIGVVLDCGACREPVFLRYRVHRYLPDRVELEPAAEELEHAAEQFAWQYLPATIAAPFRDALGCYANNLLLAFSAMCRQTARAVFAERGERERLRLFDEVSKVRELAGVDEAAFDVVRRVIFDTDLDRGGRPPDLSRGEAALLLETMKDLLYQHYVRGARLRRNLALRQFFAAADSAEDQVTRRPAEGRSA
jgi:hypothetical protein